MGVTVLDERLAFSTREACDAAGLTYRVVDYWTRQGAVWPSVPAAGYGTQRRWTIRDVDHLTRIGAVCRRAEHAGLSVGIGAVTSIWDQLAAGDGWTVTLTA